MNFIDKVKKLLEDYAQRDYEFLLRAYDDRLFDVHLFKFALLSQTGEQYTEHLINGINANKNKITLFCNIPICKTDTLIGFFLCNKYKQIIYYKQFVSTIPVNSGDTMKLQYALSCNAFDNYIWPDKWGQPYVEPLKISKPDWNPYDPECPYRAN